jgi:hypothetical protein
VAAQVRKQSQDLLRGLQAGIPGRDEWHQSLLAPGAQICKKMIECRHEKPPMPGVLETAHPALNPVNS